MQLTDAMNTWNPAVLVLRAKGFKLRAQLDENDQVCNYWAYRDGHAIVSDSPVSLLGLAAIYEHYGENWQDGLNDFVLWDLPKFHWYFVDDPDGEHLFYDGDDPDKQPS